MYYLTKKNSSGDYLFWNSKWKNFRYSGGSSYASLESAKKAYSIIVQNHNLNPAEIEVISAEAILNSYGV